MAQGSRVCPYCGGLNGAAEESCYRCGRALPGALKSGTTDLVRSVLGTEFPVTKLYLGLCFVVFALCVLDSGGFPPLFGARDPEQAERWISALWRWGALLTGITSMEPWRLLSAMFVHFSVLHLVLNMMSFVAFGRMTENQVGWARYVVIFVTSGVLGFAANELWFRITGNPVFTAGASGGLFGLGGALVGYLYARGDPNYKNVLLQLVLYAVVFALAFPVNNAAHIGGFVTGALLGFGLEKHKLPARADRLFAVVAAVLMLLSVASIALSALSSGKAAAKGAPAEAVAARA